MQRGGRAVRMIVAPSFSERGSIAGRFGTYSGQQRRQPNYPYHPNDYHDWHYCVYNPNRPNYNPDLNRPSSTTTQQVQV